MSFLLKIVEGPNKGAEIALVDGVAVTLGKSDDCDIVLADSTLDDAPLKLQASADGVSADGERLEPFHVVVRGSTAFAIGPADTAWGELVWPSKSGPAGADEKDGGGEPPAEGKDGPATPPPEKKDESPAPSRRIGCLGCLGVILIVILLAALLCWVFRDELRPHAEKARPYAERSMSCAKRWWGKAVEHVGGSSPDRRAAPVVPPETLSTVAARYGLKLAEVDGRASLSGDFQTRAERLFATAEAYSVQPGVDIDFTDGESLKTAVADTFALVGENRLSVVAVTSRVAVITGEAANLRKALEAVAADVPKVENVDVTGVTVRQAPVGATESPAGPAVAPFSQPVKGVGVRQSARSASFPVCGIFTSPYPCLVLRDGRRILEGAPVGDSVVVKIEADSVTLTNSTGRIVWKP